MRYRHGLCVVVRLGLGTEVDEYPAVVAALLDEVEDLLPLELPTVVLVPVGDDGHDVVKVAVAGEQATGQSDQHRLLPLRRCPATTRGQALAGAPA